MLDIHDGLHSTPKKLRSNLLRILSMPKIELIESKTKM